MLLNIWKFRELLLTLVRRDLIVRYQSSVLGFLWSFAKPLVLVAIFHVAFKVVLKIQPPNDNVPFAMHLLVGILAWSFLARCVTEGHWAVLSHANLIKKVKLPIEIFPAATLAGNLVNFLMEMLVVFPIILLMMAGDDGIVWPRVAWQLAASLLLTALLAFLAFALTLVVSAVNVFYRDMQAMSEVGLQAWFYATPIVYPVTQVSRLFESGQYPAWLGTLYWLNPMTPICAAYRRILLYSPLPEGEASASAAAPPGLEVADGTLLAYLSIAAAASGLLYLAAQAIFRHYARLFADEV